MKITEFILVNFESLLLVGFSLFGFLLYAFNVHFINQKLFTSLVVVGFISALLILFSGVPNEERNKLVDIPEFISKSDYKVADVAINKTKLRGALDIYLEGGVVVVNEGIWMPVKGDIIKLVRFTSQHGLLKVWKVCLSENLYKCANVQSKPDHLGLPKA